MPLQVPKIVHQGHVYHGPCEPNLQSKYKIGECKHYPRKVRACLWNHTHCSFTLHWWNFNTMLDHFCNGSNFHCLNHLFIMNLLSIICWCLGFHMGMEKPTVLGPWVLWVWVQFRKLIPVVSQVLVGILAQIFSGETFVNRNIFLSWKLSQWCNLTARDEI